MPGFDKGFKDRVYKLVSAIPEGKVMTYGQIAAICGNARAARIVGGIAHYGNPSLPWQRVVNKNGGLAAGYPGGREAHAEVLRTEGVDVSNDYYINVDEHLWRPDILGEKEDAVQPLATNYKPKTTTAKPLLVIVGETASGKTSLAVELARKFNGEIIAADSRTVYKEMDIGTAKPTKEEMGGVPHHLFDVVYPNESFSAASFKTLASDAIEDIGSRGKLPIIVGGSGLYIDALIYDYEFSPPPYPEIRQKTSKMSVKEMQDAIKDRGLKMPANDKNPRHLARVLETGGVSGQKKKIRPNTLILGLSLGRDELRRRVAVRVDEMIDAGLVGEVSRLIDKYGKNAEAFRAPGYKTISEYLEGGISLSEAKNMFIKNDMQLAKKQRTWFKRNKSIHWLSNTSDAVDLVTTFLNKIT